MKFFLVGILGLMLMQTFTAQAQTPVQTPVPVPTQAPAANLTKVERWDGSFVGCQANATPAERTKWGKRVPVVCGCLATYLVNLCQKTETDNAETVKACLLNLNHADATKVIDECFAKAKIEVVLNPFIK